MLKKPKISPGGVSGLCTGVSADDGSRTKLTYLGVDGAACGLGNEDSNAAVEEVGWFDRWRKERQVNVTATGRKRLIPQENSKIFCYLYIVGPASLHNHGTFVVDLLIREIL